MMIQARTLAWLTAALAVPTALATNEYCPVMPDQPASKRFVTDYKGRTVQFCCTNCIKAFELEPHQYLENLPPDDTQRGVIAWLGTELISYYLSPIGPVFRVTWGIAILTLLAALALFLLQRQARNKPKEAGDNRRLRYLVGALVLALVVMCGRYYRLYYMAIAEDNIHFATYYEFGNPPIPARPDVPKQLSGTYYRGNDERSPELFNGGKYRTCVFNIAVVDGTGERIDHGDDIRGRELFVDVEIVRAPHTPDYFWKPERMQRMYMTRQSDPFQGWQTEVADRVDWTEVEPMNKWVGRYRISDGSAVEARNSGLVYICEERFIHGMIAGGRFHFGVRFDVRADDGIVTAASELWMGSLYRLREVPNWYVPAHEWFSENPIPELPEPQKQDPDLLGITEHREADNQKLKR